MIAGLYTYAATALVAAALAAAGTWKVQEWRWKSKTTAEQLQREHVARVAEEARQSDAKQQRQFNDTTAGVHAATVASLSTQLGDAREKIATLSDRQCLGAGTVRMLNAIGAMPAHGVGLRATSSQLAGAPPAAAGSADDDPAAAEGAYASERDTATTIAICRSRYAEVSSQVNKILDIEEKRQQVAGSP
ncbi:hypothetical protein [Acidovorax sp. ACV01]|uniref:hypothetical protein n=1 Tax=Acidovorax sp. ACV01 TaxID=2769311 RepID=UPI00177E7662|nr:hypothetical protein [Acidovorax sp. ACV01]MBD9395126.1 hypothetical protein [Acidovorax sp. ACV01]